MPFFLSKPSQGEAGEYERSSKQDLGYDSAVDEFSSPYEFTIHMLTVPQNPQAIQKIQQVKTVLYIFPI